MQAEPSRRTRDAILDELVALVRDDATIDDLAQYAARAPSDTAAGPGLATLARAIVDLRRRLDAQAQRERGLLSVIESAEDVASRLDLTGVLDAIVSRARTLVGADAGWLSVFDAERDEFRVVVANGVFAKRTREMGTARHRGVAGVVMATRLPFATTNYLADTHFAHDPALDDTFREEGIVALVGVPLIRDGDVIGLLFVADRYARSHGPQDVAILCALATHGALALRNARDYERANAALEKADRIRDELERHVRSVQAATDAHERLTSLLARGASLATLCRTVAQLLDGRVVVLDETGRVVARGAPDGPAAEPVEGDTVPDAPADDAFSLHGAHSAALARALRASRELGRSVLAWESDGQTCRVMAVIGGADMLGTLVLLRPGALSEIAVRTFERSSSIVGIVLLSQERVEAARSGSISTLVQSLLSLRQEDPAPLVDRAARHGLDLAAPLSLLLVDVDGPGATAMARRFRTLPAFARMLVDEVDGRLLVVCAATQAVDLRRTIASVVRADLGMDFRGVQSRPFTGASRVATTHARFRRALAILRRLGARGEILDEHALALYATLFETHDPASLDAFLDATIGPLVAYDARRGTQLTGTLLQFLDSQQNARVVAERLHIHVNTVRQRLATIESTIGAWSHDASRSLELHMALRLWSLREPTRAA